MQGRGKYSITQRIQNLITEDHIRASAAVTGYLEWHSTRLKRDGGVRRELCEPRLQTLTLNLLGIGSASVVGVNLLRRGALIEGNESL